MNVFGQNTAFAGGAGNWIGWECQKAKDACIGSSTCIGVCAAMVAAGIALNVGSFGLASAAGVPLIALGTAGMATCIPILSGTSDFCSKGCPQDSSDTSPSSPIYCTPAGASTNIADPALAPICCDTTKTSQPNPSAPNPAPSGCPQLLQPSNPDVTTPLGGAKGDVSQAAEMAGGAPAIVTSPSSPPSSPIAYQQNSDAAIGGNTAPTTSLSPSNSRSEMPSSPSLSGTRTGSGSRSAAGSSGAGSASELHSSLQTDPYASPSASPSTKSIGDFAYSAGSEGGSASNGEPAGFNFTRPGATPTTGINAFSAPDAQQENGASPMLSEDPENYFNRIESSASIFKIVHLRYDSIAIKRHFISKL